MQSHYEINVSLNGKHFFATAPRSCRDEEDARRLMADFKTRFPESEGFQVTCAHWKAGCTYVTFD